MAENAGIVAIPRDRVRGFLGKPSIWATWIETVHRPRVCRRPTSARRLVPHRPGCLGLLAHLLHARPDRPDRPVVLGDPVGVLPHEPQALLLLPDGRPELPDLGPERRLRPGLLVGGGLGPLDLPLEEPDLAGQLGVGAQVQDEEREDGDQERQHHEPVDREPRAVPPRGAWPGR